jgi:hypothetical protein
MLSQFVASRGGERFEDDGLPISTGDLWLSVEEAAKVSSAAIENFLALISPFKKCDWFSSARLTPILS